MKELDALFQMLERKPLPDKISTAIDALSEVTTEAGFKSEQVARAQEVIEKLHGIAKRINSTKQNV